MNEPMTPEEKLEEMRRWARAYPLSVFPEPDLKKAHKILKEHGMSLDVISASMARHVLSSIKRILDAPNAEPEPPGEVVMVIKWNGDLVLFNETQLLCQPFAIYPEAHEIGYDTDGQEFHMTLTPIKEAEILKRLKEMEDGK